MTFPSTVVYLVRAACSTMTPPGSSVLLGSRLNPGLSACGKEQADELLETLWSRRISAVYSSPRLRAIQTADPFASARRLPVKLSPELDAVDMGDWEGRSWHDIESVSRHEAESFLSHPEGGMYPGGTYFHEVARRMFHWLARIGLRHVDQRVLAVSHEETIRAAVSAVTGLEPRQSREMGFHRGSFVVIRIWNGVPSLGSIYDPEEELAAMAS